jgi:cytidylate kinase
MELTSKTRELNKRRRYLYIYQTDNKQVAISNVNDYRN